MAAIEARDTISAQRDVGVDVRPPLDAKTLSGSYPNGYTIRAPYNAVYITAGTRIGTNGLRAGFYAQTYTKVTNAGTINGDGILAGCPVAVSNTGLIDGVYGVTAPGVTLYNGGTVASYGNTSTIESSRGADIVNGGYAHRNALIRGLVAVGGGEATIANYGVMQSQLNLNAGGVVTNGAVGDTTAVLAGPTAIDVKGAIGQVANFGQISGYGNFRNFGVYFAAGGVVTNGGPTDTGARIQAYDAVGIFGGSAVVTNWGSIVSVGGGFSGYGVQIDGPASVGNGGPSDFNALISGYTGVELQGGAAYVGNFGTIIGLGDRATRAGVETRGGGRVVNGGAHDSVALIEGATGVALDGGGQVTNLGTVIGEAGPAVYLGLRGGTLVDGSGTDRLALITGYAGVESAAAATVSNQGVISGTYGDGVDLTFGGALFNGAVNNASARIEGYTGVAMGAGGSATNMGVIEGLGVNIGAGVSLVGGASLTNGAAGHAGALVAGYDGVYATSGTVTNFGTIAGAAAAVVFKSASAVLNVEAGSTFIGAVLGGGGTLDLASGAGQLAGLLSTTGNVTVSGAIATTTFQGFGTVEIGSGATFADAGPVGLAAGQTIDCAGSLALGAATNGAIANGGLIETTGAGTLTIAGAVSNAGTIETNGGALVITTPLSGTGALLVNSGTLLVSGAVTGAGKATIAAGELEFGASSTESVTFKGAGGELVLAQSQTYAASISGFSKTGTTSLDLLDVAFVSSSEASFSGNTPGGVLTVTDGTHTARLTLKGNYTTSTFIAASDGHGGVLVIDPKRPLTASPLALITAMAGLGASSGPSAPTQATTLDRAPLIFKPGPLTA